ncbi:MAG TPA: response regulator [Candidatus Angelobacter sp.]|nr:response regulator [Candidatus Angelobacter sp.]
MCSTSRTTVDNMVHARPSVLCVDDSEDILLICRTVLESGGYQVFTAANGADALQFLKKHPVDAAVIDSVMPGMCGTDLAREIKRVAANVPVIMFSSSERPHEVAEFVDSYLSKGQGPIALRKLVGVLLQR